MAGNTNHRSEEEASTPVAKRLAAFRDATPMRSILAAAFAGTSIVVIGLLTSLVMPEGGPAVIASMGAAAVIVFQFPESPAAQPWSIIGGHLLSATIGVVVSQLVDDRTVAAGLAVGLSLGAMQVCRCMHPPGGGTAMVAVLGGAAIQDAGFRFVILPTLVNAIILTGLSSGFRWMFTKTPQDKHTT